MGRLKAMPPRLRPAPSRWPKETPKTTDAHYGSAAHKAWAAASLNRADHRCEDSEHDDRHPRSGVRLYADHVVERKDGGADLDPANSMVRCARCHGRKTARERARRLRDG